uniref:Uncharacterized protein n=1 Tax=Anguilla anguilla TaxID=7936 RepID=A0A0E9VQ18_ANGAN
MIQTLEKSITSSNERICLNFAPVIRS